MITVCLEDLEALALLKWLGIYTQRNRGEVVLRHAYEKIDLALLHHEENEAAKTITEATRKGDA